MFKNKPKFLLLISGAILIVSWLFVGILPTNAENTESSTGRAFAPIQTEEPSDANNPDDVDPANIPETVTITGTIENGTADGAVPDGLTVELFSIVFDEAGRPTDDLDSADIEADGANFSYEGLAISVNTGVLAQVVYNDIPYLSQVAPSTDMLDGTIELIVTIYETTADTSGLQFSNIWYIVGASPEEDVAEIYNWYFVENDSDYVIQDGENGSIRIELPPNAYGIEFEAATGRFSVDDSGDRLVVIDTNPVRPNTQDQIVMRYFLPYPADELTFTQALDYPTNSLNVYVARIFDLDFEAEGFIETEIAELRGLGDYNHYVYDAELSADEAFTFQISGGPQLAPVTADIATGSEETDGSFLDDNANFLLIIGGLMVALGFAYLFVDLQRQRSQLTQDLAQMKGSGSLAKNDNAEKERLLDEIAQLDEAFANGEVESGYYDRKRAELKDRVRDLLGG